MLELMKRKQQRFRYLETLYKMVGGSPMDTVTHHKIGVEARLTTQSAEDAFYYLLNEELLKAQYLAGVVSITHLGVKTYEASMDKSEKRARQHTGEEASGPSIQRGKLADTKEVYPSPTPGDIGEFIGHLRESLPALAVDGRSETLILDEIETIETQLKSAKPKKQLIMAAMQNLKGALTNSLFDAGVRFLLSRLRELM